MNDPELSWYEREWLQKETPGFVTWWAGYYGQPEDYVEQDEYWVRRAFALAGWLAARE